MCTFEAMWLCTYNFLLPYYENMSEKFYEKGNKLFLLQFLKFMDNF